MKSLSNNHTMESAAKPFNICDTLRNRLQEINDLKEATQAKIETINEQLQKLYSKSIKGPRATPAQLDEQINELEARRTETSLPLAEEKAILRQIDQIKKSKVQYEVNQAHENTVQMKKNELNSFRDDLSKYKVQISELEAALSKVELAARLGCSANDLTSHILHCPVDKIGSVIGKGGSNIKKLQTKTGCLIDLDKEKHQINIQGNESSINKAIAEIENITLAVDVEMEMGEAQRAYFSEKQYANFAILQNKHPNVIFNFSKESTSMKLHGREEFIIPAKEDVLSVDVHMEKLLVESREASAVVGKGGKTINSISVEHKVNIQVENLKNSDAEGTKSTIQVYGNKMKVMAAVKEIKEVLFNYEEMEVSILVSAMTRKKLLARFGVLVKQLQKDVNMLCQPGSSYVRFEELKDGEERDSPSILTVKSPRMHIAEAERIVKERIAGYDSSVLTMQIDIDLIPTIIGPKGATIKSIKNLGGPAADVLVDKLTGEVKLMADEKCQRDAMKKAIDDLNCENQILRIPMEEAMFSDLFGKTGYGVKNKIQGKGVYLKIDDSNTAVLLRGPIEKITEAAEDIRQFIASKQFIELSCDSTDESFLIHRADVKKNLEKDFGVKISMSKAKHGVVVIKGRRECIESAEKELKKILYGGDDFAVEKMFVHPSVIGTIIGKGGKNILTYESDHDSVMIHVHSLTNQMSIRGSPEQVERCKGIVTKDIMDCMVVESVQINAVAHQKLSKQGSFSNLFDGLPVNMTLGETSVRVRGCFSDVQETKMYVNHLVSGIYKSIISLIPENFNIISKSMETNPSQFDEISEATETSISVDKSIGAIIVEGKRPAAKRAKSLLLNLFQTLIPTGFSIIKFLKPLLKTIGNAKKISTLGQESRCFITLERDICTFIIQASSAEKLQIGTSAVRNKIDTINKLLHVFHVETWLMTHFLTNCIEDVEKIQSDTDCEIYLLKSDVMISVIGKKEASVTNAKVEIEKIIDRAKKEHVFIDLPQSCMNSFVGKTGAHIKLLGATYGVSIDRVKKTKSQIHVQGKEQSVRLAVEAIEDWLLKWEKNNKGLTVPVNEVKLLLLKKDKSILDDIQRDFAVKIDLNRQETIATIRGGTRKKQVEAEAQLKSILCIGKVKESKNDHADKENTSILPKAIVEKATIDIPPKQQVMNVLYQEGIKSNIEDSVPMELDSVMKNSNNSTVGHLYNLLVSDDIAQQWDSSTVSSKVDNENESPVSEVSYCRSTSGFHIRL